MGHATPEQLKKTSDLLSQGQGSDQHTSQSWSTPIMVPGVWELDSKGIDTPPIAELDSNQAPSLTQMPPVRTEALVESSHTSSDETGQPANRSMRLDHFINSRESSSIGRETMHSGLMSPPPYAPSRQPVFPVGVENEKSTTRDRELANSSSTQPPPAYNRNSRSGEGYVSYQPEYGRTTGQAARPRSVPPASVEHLLQRRAEPVTSTAQQTSVAANPESPDESTALTLPHATSSDVQSLERVPSLPHQLPPLEAFEPVSFSISINRNAHAESSGTQASAAELDNWHWDIEF